MDFLIWTFITAVAVFCFIQWLLEQRARSTAQADADYWKWRCMNAEGFIKSLNTSYPLSPVYPLNEPPSMRGDAARRDYDRGGPDA